MTVPAADKRGLKIVHVLRAPLGGLFRHVIDLTREQVARGHAVGLVTDSLTGGERADATLAALEPSLALGLTRVPMHRNPHVTDLAVLTHVSRRLRRIAPDVIHGHGSKGGLFARLALLPRRGAAITAYTPHGGSFNYQPGTSLHWLYMTAEGVLARATDVLLFESAYISTMFARHVGPPPTLARIVLNGVSAEELVPVDACPDAADFVYVGELRSAKGIDTLIDAIATLRARTGHAARAVLVGSGPDTEKLKAQATNLDLADCIAFTGPLPAREAFTRGRTMVVPSRAESLPYVVLEAAGAQIPMIATNVGGIPEIFGPYADRLIPCNDTEALTGAMLDQIALGDGCRKARAQELATYVGDRFTITRMVNSVLAGYHEAMALKAARTAPRVKRLATSS